MSKKLQKPWLFLAGSLAFSLTALPAQADPIVVATTAFGPLTPASTLDSFSLEAGSYTFNIPSTGIFQTGDFIVVSDNNYVAGTKPFNFTENVTVNGITQTVSFSGNIELSDTADTLTFNPGSAQSFGSILFTPLGLSISATDTGSHPFSLQASIASTATPIPAPGTVWLMLTGLAALRKFGKRQKV